MLFLTKLQFLTLPELRKCAENLYPNDLEASLYNELVQFKSIIDAGDDDQVHSILHMSKLLSAKGSLLLPTFPNVGIALRIYLTIPVNKCKGERSFQLWEGESHFRSMMSQERLVLLTIISIV